MKIKFCGAAREVTGSSHLITLDDGFTILLDCGLFQGNVARTDDQNANWFFNPAEIDLMILSHAHIDHCGRIPKLVKDGFKGDIFCTHATRDLASIMLMDSAHIQEKDTQRYNERLEDKKSKNKNYKGKHREPLYTAKDVAKAMENFVGMGYDRLIEIAPGVHLIFTDAGHILGSATVNLRIKRGGDDLRFAFSGDVGRPNRPILKDPHPMIPSDVIICESTYGDRDHIEKPQEISRFTELIHNTCVENKGKVIIPAFSLGRTQEIVYLLDQIEKAGNLPDIPVYVDSPLAVNATEVFRSHPECFDFELHQYILSDPDPFGFNRLYYIHEVNDSKKLNTSKEPCIIISAAGMVNAGRIKHHVFNNVDNHRNTLLFVGYCSPETPGGILRSGAEFIKMFGEIKPVRASIEIMDSFSAHGDRHELLNFLGNQVNTASQTYLVHGDPDAQEAFKILLENNGFDNVHIPDAAEEINI
ncbi:MAG: MBL fold metallo-hydrolase [Saprospiraceae bacterium]|nr:MBL fold metallo-hydrolase [Saprospiraceae bacterium]